jgi:AcrR family transcriptional regulator
MRVTPIAPAADSLRAMPDGEPTPSADPTVRRRVNTRARLLAAAEDVFVSKGLKRVTVDDLVGAAGFTRGAFYSNFSSIEEVFYALFKQQSETMLAIVREVVDQTPEGEFSIGLVLERLRPISARWYVIQAEFTLLALRSEEARALFQEHRAMFEDQMVGVIADLVARLGRVPTVPLAQLTETAIALYLHSLAQEGLGMGTLDTEELTNIVLPQVILGLSRPADD